MGEFELLLVELTAGQSQTRGGISRGEAGTAFLLLPCARLPIFGPVLERLDVIRMPHAVEVVAEVMHPQTKITVADASRFRPEARVGETVSLGIDDDRARLGDIVWQARGVPDWLSGVPGEAGFAAPPTTAGSLTNPAGAVAGSPAHSSQLRSSPCCSQSWRSSRCRPPRSLAEAETWECIDPRRSTGQRKYANECRSDRPLRRKKAP